MKILEYLNKTWIESTKEDCGDYDISAYLCFDNNIYVDAVSYFLKVYCIDVDYVYYNKNIDDNSQLNIVLTGNNININDVKFLGPDITISIKSLFGTEKDKEIRLVLTIPLDDVFIFD